LLWWFKSFNQTTNTIIWYRSKTVLVNCKSEGRGTESWEQSGKWAPVKLGFNNTQIHGCIPHWNNFFLYQWDFVVFRK
jgi:hypothetical protein